MRVNDAILGAILIVFAAAMIALTHDFPTLPGQDYGPGLFPRVLGVGLIACGLVLVVRGWRNRAGEPWIVLDAWTRDPVARRNVLLILAALVFFLVAAHTLGFLLTAMLILLGLFLAYGVAPWLSAILSVAATAVVFYAFTVQLRVPLPRGLLEPLVGF